MTVSQADLPATVSREQIIRDSDAVLGMPDIPVSVEEDIVRIEALGMDWDIGMMIYQPRDEARIPCGADGRKVGIFLLHGGSGDSKTMDRVALLAAGKFGFKVLSATFPGRFTSRSRAGTGRMTPSTRTVASGRPSGSRAS